MSEIAKWAEGHVRQMALDAGVPEEDIIVGTVPTFTPMALTPSPGFEEELRRRLGLPPKQHWISPWGGYE